MYMWCLRAWFSCVLGNTRLHFGFGLQNVFRPKQFYDSKIVQILVFLPHHNIQLVLPDIVSHISNHALLPQNPVGSSLLTLITKKDVQSECYEEYYHTNDCLLVSHLYLFIGVFKKYNLLNHS